VALPKFMIVGGGATPHDGAIVTVMFGIEVEQTSTISCN
jgi:hypothetical protein